MARSTPPAPAGPVDEHHLARVARLLDEALALEVGDAPQLVRLRVAPAGELRADELELGCRPAASHPLDELVGFTAPADWAAVGVVGTGRARHLDGGPVVPVRSVQLVARGGAWASRWTPFDRDAPIPADTATGDARTDGGDVPTGRIDDALRRVLGVETAPPPGTTVLLWAVQWLDALVAAAAAAGGRRPRRRTLDALVAAHPAVAALGLDPASVGLPKLIAESRRLATWRGWSQLRSSCAAGRWTSAEVDAATAAWLDDGAFARWVLAGWPDLGQLHEAAGSLLAPSAMSVVDDALEAWGLDPGAS